MGKTIAQIVMKTGQTFFLMTDKPAKDVIRDIKSSDFVITSEDRGALQIPVGQLPDGSPKLKSVNLNNVEQGIRSDDVLMYTVGEESVIALA